VKGESSAVEGVDHKSLRRNGAYQLKLKCTLSTRGAKCFLLLGALVAGVGYLWEVWGLMAWQICILRELQQICVLFRKTTILLARAVRLYGCLCWPMAMARFTRHFRARHIAKFTSDLFMLAMRGVIISKQRERDSEYAWIWVWRPGHLLPLPQKRRADNELYKQLTRGSKIWKTKNKKKSMENTEIKRDKAHKANARHNGHLDRQIYR